MRVALKQSKVISGSNITITGSKSESNRLLLLQALYPHLEISNVSNSDDSQLMQKALHNDSDLVDIHHAGTAMRFLTAYFSIQPNREVTLTGSSRMQERPIKILVDALRELGADIQYEKNEGFPPLRIKGNASLRNKVTMKANVSSQYISALLLIGSKLKEGITLHLEGEITSVPYIEMTLELLRKLEIKTSFVGNTIQVQPKETEVKDVTIVVESDWSSASYFYSCVALSEVGSTICLSSYRSNSLQGDSSLIEFYEAFGVETSFNEHQIVLTKVEDVLPNTKIAFDLSNSPDLAQTISVTCLGLGLPCHLTGLHTLKIKETDRLIALQNEIEKFGTRVDITDSELSIDQPKDLLKDVAVDTYKDHRMAMAFAPLALKTSLVVNDADVVSKSYPDFWQDMSKVGIEVLEF